MEETSYFFDSLDLENLASPYTIVGSNVNLTPQSSPATEVIIFEVFLPAT